MARGINKVILVGNAGQDPEIRNTTNGSQVTNITVATSESWTDKQTGQKQDRTEWHRVVFFNKLAEIAGQYLKKGSKVYIEGSLRTRKWQDQNGQDRYTTEIVANEMQMLDSRGSQDGAQPPAQPQMAPAQPQMAPAQPQMAPAQAPQQPAQPQTAPAQAPQQQPAQPQGGFDDFDDDIPF